MNNQNISLTLVPKEKHMEQPNRKKQALEILKKGALGILKFSSKAVFYLPRREEHMAVRGLKVAALIHSAYEAFLPEDNKDDVPNSDTNEPTS